MGHEARTVAVVGAATALALVAAALYGGDAGAGSQPSSITISPTLGPSGTQIQAQGSCGSQGGVDWDVDGVLDPTAFARNFARVQIDAPYGGIRAYPPDPGPLCF